MPKSIHTNNETPAKLDPTVNTTVFTNSQGQCRYFCRMYSILQCASVINASIRIHRMPLVSKSIKRGDLFSRTCHSLHLISLMPEPLLGNESGNWNPSGLFGTFIILLPFDSIIQCQWWVPSLWSFFCIFILFVFSVPCIVIHLENYERDKVEGLWVFLYSVFFFWGLLCLCFMPKLCPVEPIWMLQKISDEEACYETSVSLNFTLWTSWRQGLRDRGRIERQKIRL